MALKLLVASLAVASAFKVDSAAPKPALDKTLALRGGLSVETTSLLGALYNGGFGVTLMANPDMCANCVHPATALARHARRRNMHARTPPYHLHHMPTCA